MAELILAKSAEVTMGQKVPEELCAACGVFRPRADLLVYWSAQHYAYVCRPTLRSPEHGDGWCFNRAVCWVGHHRIAAA